MKKNKLKKILIITGASVLALILALGIFIGALWHNEISSVMSIKMLMGSNEENKSGPVYLMDVSGGYYFDEFIENGGASSDDELIDFIVKNLTKGIIPIDLSAPDIGCSSFTGMGEDGTRYFGRNYDFSTSTAMIVRTAPRDGRYASISSADLQFIGINEGREISGIVDKVLCLAAVYTPLDGINEAGVSCGIYMTYQGGDGWNAVSTDQTTEKPDITSTTMLRLILDYAGSVEEAIALVEKYDLHDSANTSFHYMVADSTGKSAILEWVYDTDDTDNDGTKRELKVYYNDGDQAIGENEAKNDFQYITNFVVTPDYYNSDEYKAGLDRYKKIESMIDPNGDNSKGIITEDTAFDVLEAVGRRNWDKLNGKSDSNSITVWSALYNLTERKVTWISNEEFDNEKAIFTFDFSYLD